jgi:hypothetical protein
MELVIAMNCRPLQDGLCIVLEDSQVPISGMWVSSSHSSKSGVTTFFFQFKDNPILIYFMFFFKILAGPITIWNWTLGIKRQIDKILSVKSWMELFLKNLH